MRPSTDPNEVVMSIRVPRRLLEQVDELVTHGPRTGTRAGLLRELLAAGVEVHRVRQAEASTPEAVAARIRAEKAAAQARRDARIKDPPWGPQLRELHAQGLTNQEIAEQTGWTRENVRQKLFKLKLAANR
jgi:DNA-binding NarL/FixJ family response regulator